MSGSRFVTTEKYLYGFKEKLTVKLKQLEFTGKIFVKKFKNHM